MYIYCRCVKQISIDNSSKWRLQVHIILPKLGRRWKKRYEKEAQLQIRENTRGDGTTPPSY